MFIRFDRMYKRDRQTVRQTPHDDIGRAYASHRAAKINRHSCSVWFYVIVSYTHILYPFCFIVRYPHAIGYCFARRQAVRLSVGLSVCLKNRYTMPEADSLADFLFFFLKRVCGVLLKFTDNLYSPIHGRK